MRPASAIVYIIDDDDIALWMFEEFLHGIDAEIRSFSSARTFLEAYRAGPRECLVCDLKMPEIGGLEVQRQLLERQPFADHSGLGPTPKCTPPSRRSRKVPSIFSKNPSTARCWSKKCRARWSAAPSYTLAEASRSARSLLAPKERQIAELVVAGKSSPRIAEELEISVRTVENHRARLMEKLDVASAVELVRLFL